MDARGRIVLRFLGNTPSGGVQTIELASGKVIWQTNQAQRPLCVADGKLLLGTWQGIYLWELRTHAHTRRIVVTVTG